MSATVGRRVRLVATARQKYDGRSLVSGDEFEATAQDAEDLIALHMARPAESEPRIYRRRDMRAEK
jgi:hypothetical protein